MVWVIPKDDFGLLTGGNSFIEVKEVANKVRSSATYTNADFPLVVNVAPSNTRNASFIPLLESHVLHVGFAGYVSQVRDPVVGLDAVDVVDVMLWPFTVVQ